MKMRLGLEAGPHTLALAQELGVSGVPIGADQLVAQGASQTMAYLAERGLRVCQIGAFGFNPLAPDVGAQAKQRATLERAIPLAAEVGCPYIVINGGNHHPSAFGGVDARNYSEEALDQVAGALTPLVRLAKDHGACICIEPYLKTAVCSSERFLALWKKVGSDALRVNLDVTSLYTYWDLVDPSQTVQHICTSLAGHCGLGHVKEVALSEGFHLHAGLVPLGQGPTDWAQVLKLMVPALPADSWVVLEHVATPEEARNSVALLRQYASEAGVELV